MCGKPPNGVGYILFSKNCKILFPWGFFSFDPGLWIRIRMDPHGSAWIRIHFPSWIRIRIQEGKYVN